MEKVIEKKRFTANAGDWLRGLLFAVAVPVLSEIVQTFQSGSFDINWATVGATAAGALLAYMTKQYLFEPTKITVLPEKESTVVEVRRSVLNNEGL